MSHRGSETAEEMTARHSSRARELRVLLTELGPTFIKAGQAVSIRPDVVPPGAIYELQKLCDAVPSYPTHDALRLIEAELGQPPAQIFSGLDLDSEPIAAASLGQVYRCRMRDSGAEVALKVQRPDMIRAVSLDLYLLRRYCVGVEWCKENIVTGLFGAADRSAFDVKLLDTFARASYLELDYRNEAANLERFREALVPRMGGRVYVPFCEGSVTTRKVLATEWIDGPQLAKSTPEVINKLISTGVDCFISQLLDIGFFHSDPHPGNLLVDARGRLVLIDFGLCAEIDAFDSRSLTSAIVHLMRGDVSALVDDAIALRFLPPDVDKAALLPPLEGIFAKGRLAAAEEIARRAQPSQPLGATAVEEAEQAANQTTRRAQFSAISRELNQIFFDYPFAVPEYFALITRALIVLEGIALTGDKDFDLFTAAYPIAAKHASKIFGAAQLAAMLGEASALPLASGRGGLASTLADTLADASSSADTGGATSSSGPRLGRTMTRALS